MDERLHEIEMLYRTRFDAFWRTAAAIMGDREGARDVVQDAFATAVRRRADFRGEGALEGWIWRILVNTARSSRRARPLALADAADRAANGHVPDADARVRGAIAALPDRQRLAIFLRYFGDLDYEGIAAALDARPGTVAATLNAAHAGLRRRLQEVSQ